MYKVIALSVSGKGKKIFSAGDVVSENDFPTGSIQSLLKGGYIQLIEKAKVVSEKPIEVVKPVEAVKPIEETKSVVTKKVGTKKTK